MILLFTFSKNINLCFGAVFVVYKWGLRGSSLHELVFVMHPAAVYLFFVKVASITSHRAKLNITTAFERSVIN